MIEYLRKGERVNNKKWLYRLETKGKIEEYNRGRYWKEEKRSCCSCKREEEILEAKLIY